MKVLIIEDEPELSASITDYLSGENYLCETASSFRQALEKINAFDYDCILLDLMLPGGNGLDILQEIKRRKREEGVIIISAKDAVDDKIKGLQIGADDYISKPFHLAELAARIYSLIRRKQFNNTNVLRQEEIEVNLLAKTVHVHDKPVNFTRKELDLLLYFMANRNRVVSKTALAEHLSGDIADMLDSHDFVYAHIKNLKKKLAEAGATNYLKTIYGSGYKWES
ncbi:response regulator transcription factor [Nostoc ellipsosporum NOK]|nr:response regulator transcription factor [Nostoc ellipsosporum NOK]